MNWKQSIGLGVICCLLTSCLETKDHYIINPDGSGKVKHQALFQQVTINLSGEKRDPEKDSRKAVMALLKDSKGVEAWSDVTYKIQPDGRVLFNGTAYFRDVSKLTFKHGGTSFNLLDPRFESGILTLDWEKEGEDTSESNEPLSIGEEDLAAERAKYQQMKPMMAAMLGTLKVEKTFTLPGPVAEVSNMEKSGPQEVRVAIQGSEILSVLDTYIQQGEWLKQQLEQGRDWQKDFKPDDSLNEQLLGSAGPVQARVGEGAQVAVFDYDKEVAAAEAAYGSMLTGLGLDVGSSVAALKPPAEGQGFKKIYVGGARLVKDLGRDDVRPFNWMPGFTLSLVGEFDGAVLDVDEAEVTEASAVGGGSLLPESSFDRRIHHPSLSDDGSVVVFEVKMKSPKEGQTGISRVGGAMQYYTAQGTREQDLKMASLKETAKGEVLDAVIKSREKRQWGDSTRYQLSLFLEIPRSYIKEVHFFDSTGKRLDGIKKNGHSASGDSVTFTFSSDSEIPEEGNIKVILHDQIKKFKIPFEVSNIDWLGNPLP
ncbi:MAG: hypothetical protein AAF558_04550 [Verrucomicrobiota bacterium]